MSENEIRVLYVQPGKYPEERTIPNTLRALQELVGGDIECCRPWRDSVCVICNDSGKIDGLPPNRLYGHTDFLAGSFVVCGNGGEDFISLTDRQVFLYERLYHISAMKFSAKHKKMRRKTALIYSEAERKEIERVYGVFKDYIHASKFLDFVWSEKLGYLLLHIDPTKNTIEEDQIITSADELCAELFNEVATDVFQEAKREHFYPDADDDEIAEIRRRWQPYLDLLPAYRSSCRAFHTAE